MIKMGLDVAVNGLFEGYRTLQENHPVIGAMITAEVVYPLADAISQLIVDRRVDLRKVIYTAKVSPFYGVTVAAVIYISFTLFLLIILYFFGRLLVFLLFRNKDDTLSFHINFIAGIYSVSFVSLMIILYNQPTIRNIIAVVGVILFFPAEYIAVKGPR